MIVIDKNTEKALVKAKPLQILCGINNVVNLLVQVATVQTKGIYYINHAGNQFFSYADLYDQSRHFLAVLKSMGCQAKQKIIFQIADNQKFMIALWACFMGDMIPVVNPMLTKADKEDNAVKRLIDSLELLEHPLVLSDETLFPILQVLEIVDEDKLHCFETLSAVDTTDQLAIDPQAGCDDLALLMFTSGSTGVPKGVKLTHSNLIASAFAKSQALSQTSEDVTFNWMVMSHVAACVENHIRDIAMCSDQVHSPVDYIVTNPLNWFDIIETHRINISFTPNFALGLLSDALSFAEGEYWDLSSLRHLIVGGELIVPLTVKNFLAHMVKFNLDPSSFTGGFGMTETCAGMIFSKGLSVETINNHQFVSLGFPAPGAAMRIVDEDNQVLDKRQIGILQLQGEMVTQGYYNNPLLNAQSFTTDGWFNTGDLAYISDQGLVMIGRDKDMIIINGMNYSCQEIEAVVNEIGDIVSSCTAAFSLSSGKKDTEDLVVIFSPMSNGDLKKIITSIKQVLISKFGLVADFIIPVDSQQIEKTDLGKIKRKMLREGFIQGIYDKQLQQVNDLFRTSADYVAPRNKIEEKLQAIWCKIFKFTAAELSVVQNFHEFGGTSLQLLQLNHAINNVFDVQLGLSDLFQNPSVAAIAQLLNDTEESDYQPLIMLNHNRQGASLFLISPMLGEALVFYELAKLMDVPCYGFQARGLRRNETCFANIEEAASTYIKAMRAVQAQGPYYLGGYSYGGLVLFEMVKQLEADNQQVAFAGNFDLGLLPFHVDKGASPHRVKETINLAMIVDLLQLIPLGIEDYHDQDEIKQKRVIFANLLSKLSKEEQYNYILKHADQEKVTQLCLTKEKLRLYEQIGITHMTTFVSYWVKGCIKSSMDIFYTGSEVGEGMLAWKEFVNGELSFHSVSGVHFDLFDQPHTHGLAMKLQNILLK